MRSVKLTRFPDGKVLVFEECSLAADILAECVRSAGAEVAGPVATLSAALDAIEEEEGVKVLVFTEGCGDEFSSLYYQLSTRGIRRVAVTWPFSEAELRRAVHASMISSAWSALVIRPNCYTFDALERSSAVWVSFRRRICSTYEPRARVLVPKRRRLSCRRVFLLSMGGACCWWSQAISWRWRSATA